MMEAMKSTRRAPSEAVEDFVRRCYCVCGADGREDLGRVQRAAAAVAQAEASKVTEFPHVPGVPHLRYRVDKVGQIPEAIRCFLSEVEADPRLHALSFIDPLRLANELGIAVSPAVARTVRRGLAGVLSFDLESLDANGRLRGIEKINWRPKK
jgi:hypothetical protein